MIKIVKRIIASSIVNLFKNQPDILTHTPQTTMTEWNLAHHLANEIAKYIFWLNHDLDVVKRSYGERPDIIFHKRGINALNFLVVELKRHDYIQNDIKKIKKNLLEDPLKYRFGASVVIESEKDWKIHLFERNGNDERTIKSSIFKYNLPLPLITSFTESIVHQIEALVDKIFEAKKKDENADTSKWEREIDMFVYKLYDLTEEEIKIIDGNIKQ